MSNILKGLNEGLADEFMAMAKAKGMNPRLAGTPEQERERTQQMLAQRAKDREQQEKQNSLKDFENIEQLKSEYEEMLRRYKSLGGSNWQYADREQNLSSGEREARSMEPALNQLGNRIARAQQHGSVSEAQKETDYGPEYQAMVKRVGQLAKEGPRKTVYDPVKRVYKTVPLKQSGISQGVKEGTDDKEYRNWNEYEYELKRKASKALEYLHDVNPELFTRHGDEFLMNIANKLAVSNPNSSVMQVAGNILRHLKQEVNEEQLSENLHKWFKEKWVRFGPDGKIRGACARGDDSEGKPKCLPQAKAHSLGKKGRKYAAAKKRREDPNPERRGPAKNVATKKKSNEGVAEGFSNDMSTEDMIAYLKQHHDKNLHPDYLNHLTSTNSKFVLKNIPLNSIRTELAGLDRAKVEQYKQMDFSKAPPIVVGSDGNILDGYHRATVAKALGIPTIKAYVGVKGEQGVAEAELDEACWKGYHKEGNKKMFGKTYPNCVKNTNEEQLDEKCWDTHKQVGMKNKGGKMVPNCVPKESVEESHQCPECGGEMVSEELMNEKKDACYYKVKSRYKVWPSAYASGALVKCRKKGADSWGTGGKKNESVDEGQIYMGGNKPAGMRWYEPRTVPSQDKLAKKESAIMKGVQLEGNDEEYHTGGSLGTPYPGTYEQERKPFKSKGQQRTQSIAFEEEQLDEKWSEKYKHSIDCSNPKGFSQKAHCQGRKK